MTNSECRMEESWAFGALCFRWLGEGLAAEADEKSGGRFVVWILGNQFTSKCLCQNGWSEALNRFLRHREAGFDPVGEGEQGFDPADDFLLFGEWWEEDFQIQQNLLIQINHC